MTTFSIPFMRYCRGAWLLALLMLPLLGQGQTTIAIRDFETTPATPTASVTFSGTGGAALSGSSASTDLPASSPYYSSSTTGYARTGTGSQNSAVITSSADINTTGYTGITLSLRLASFSVGSSQGADTGDIVTVEVSTNSGGNWSSELTVNGNGNARWPFSATGVATTAYDGNNTPTAVQSGAGTQTGTGGLSTLTVTGLPAVTGLRFRISLNNDNANERWIADDIKVVGTPAGPTITTSSVSNTPVCANAASNVTVSYSTTGTITGTYSAELSDASGSFATPTSLAKVSEVAGTSITVTIPAGTLTGSGYLIRVLNTAPAAITSSAPVGTAFAISNLAVSLAPTTLGLTVGQTNATALTATETPAATSRIWKYGTTSGSAYNNTIGSQTGTSYTPQPADFGGTAGTYYVVAQSTLGGCVVTSNQSVITVSPATGATILVSTPSLNLGTVGTNTAGLISTYTVSGSLLTAGITITPPAGVEISKDGFVSTANTNATPLVLPQSGGNVASTTISVRLAASATTGPVSGNIAHTSTTASQTVAVTGTVAAPASSCASTGFEGTPFPATGYTITGAVTQNSNSNLGASAAAFGTAGAALTLPVVANPSSITFYLARSSSTGVRGLTLQVSTTTAAGAYTPVVSYANTVLTETPTYTMYTVDLSAYSGNPTVYIQFIKTGANNPLYLDDVTVSCGAAPAFTLATGSISPTAFCVNQGAGTAVSVPFTVSGGSFGTGNVFTAYLSNDNFVANKLAIGTLTGVSSGTISGSIPQVAGLTTASSYRIRVEASTPATTSTDNGSNLTVTSYLDNEVATATAVAGNAQATLSFTTPANCATNVIVTIKAGSTGGVKPTTGPTYTANTAFGSGTDLGGGQYVVYNGVATGNVTVTGLTNNTQYAFQVFTTAGSGYSNGTLRTVRPVTPATLTEVVVPQLISARTTASTHTTRLPYVWRASISALTPNATYKYYTAVRIAADVAGYGGVGVPIEVKTAGSFVRGSLGLTSASSTFVTDASGSYTGWFAVEPSADARFADGSVLNPMVVLNAGDGADVPTHYLATTSTVTAALLSTGSTQATGVRGTSFATPGNFILSYDNTTGTGRPLAGTFVESDGTDATSYVGFYGTNVNGVAGAWGLLTPNNNANGIRRLEQRALADGSVVGCPATDADGVWPSGASTVSPTGGTTARVLTTGDAPFQPATVTGFTPSGGTPGTTITITGTNFTTGPAPTVSFNGGTAVATTFVSTTSVTVAVPASASSGPLTLTAGCGTTVAVGAFVVVPNAYYTKATGALDQLATFGDQPDGSGTAPTSFALAGTTYTVNGTGRTFGSNWTVSGTGTKVVLAANAELIIPATAIFAGTLDQSANSTLVIQNATSAAITSLIQGVQNASSTIDLAQTGGVYNVPPDFANSSTTYYLDYANLKLTGGSKRFADTFIPGTLTLENTIVSGSVANGGNANSYTMVTLGGSLNQLSGVSYDRTRNFSLALSGTSSVHTLSASGGIIEVYQLQTPSSGAVQVALDGSNGGTVLMVGNSFDGGVNLRNSTSSLQLNPNTTLRFFYDGTTAGGGNFFTSSIGKLKLLDGSNLEFYRTTTNEFSLGDLIIDPAFNTVSNLLLNSGATGASNLTLNNDLNITGTLSLLKGTLELGGNQLALSGNFVTATGGLLRGSSSSSLVFTGSGPVGTLPFVTAAAGRALLNFTINRTNGTIALGAPLALSGTLALTNGIITTDATNLFTLTNGATITGGSADSHINGPLARTANSGARTVFFPVGKAGNYRPLTLTTSTQTNTVTYRAEQIESAPTGNTYAAGSNLTRVSFKRYFTITPSTVPTGYAGTLTMTFGADDYVNFPADPTFVVAKRSTSAAEWTNIGHTTETGTATNGAPVAGTITSGTFNSFSDFSLASTSTANFFPGLNPLPVQLISFTAQRQDANIALQWATASEKNSAYFDVQRSQNAKDFTTIAKINAAGSSNKKATYQALDRNAPTTQLYYRLRQVDTDGTVGYSPVMAVAASGKAFETAIYPNPAHEILNFATAGPVSYRISNVLGQVLLQGAATTGAAAVAVTSLASGTYYLELQTATGRTVRKFSKE